TVETAWRGVRGWLALGVGCCRFWGVRGGCGCGCAGGGCSGGPAVVDRVDGVGGCDRSARGCWSDALGAAAQCTLGRAASGPAAGGGGAGGPLCGAWARGDAA